MNNFTKTRESAKPAGHRAAIFVQLLLVIFGAASALAQDALGGKQFLLKQDDVLLLQVNQVQGNPGAWASLMTLNTLNSNFQPQGNQDIGRSGFNNTYQPGGMTAAIGVGRMFNTSNDSVVTITVGNQGQFETNAWTVNYWNPNPNNNSQQHIPINSALQPNGVTVASRVVMGDFNGDNLSDALLCVQSNFSGSALWGMNILTAADITKVDSLKQGPQISGQGSPAQPFPQFQSIAVGDFNGDGRDEIAAMTNNTTLQFYTVDPVSFAITPSASIQLTDANGNVVPLNPATLAGGRFRNLTNDELVVIGRDTRSVAITIFSIQTMQQQQSDSGTTPPPVFAPSIASMFVETVSNNYSYGQYGIPPSAIFAQAAPISDWYSAYNEQLVLGFQYQPGGANTNNTGFVWIGSFDPNSFNFTLLNYTDVLSGNGCLLGMQVGNFDNRNADGTTRNPNLQIALFENQGQGDALCTPNFDDGYLHVKIVKINAQRPFDLQNPPPTPSNDWLTDASDIVPNFPDGYNALQYIALATGDLQGRSLRLGPPEVVTLSKQTQPDLVLSVPPMHIDYISPNTNQLDPEVYPDCQNPHNPCILNLTVIPTADDTNPAFTTSFKFASQASATGKRKATTSWGLSVKLTSELKVGWSVPEVGSSVVDIKDSLANTYDSSFSKENQEYNSSDDDLSVVTGFGDYLFFTSRTQTVYYYPVLGRTGCPQGQQTCNPEAPLYVVISMPGDHSSDPEGHVDATSQDWYQPVHEPGNILSYAWNLNRLQQQFGQGMQSLTRPQCYSTDGSLSNAGVNWTASDTQTTSSGWTNKMTNDLSMSYTTTVGSEEAGDFVQGSLGVDIGSSISFGVLNTTAQYISASSGVALNKPEFDSGVNGCCGYAFTSYILGLNNPNQNFQQACKTSNQAAPDPPGCIPLDNQDTNKPQPVDMTGIGPLFVAYLADPVPDAAGGLTCGPSALSSTWWREVYNLPDVAVNHPERWAWSNDSYEARFQRADPTLDPLTQGFYHMKGFFITQAGSRPAGMTLGQATAGDQLTLSARVHNFSLKDTNDPTLRVPASKVHVRFYGQEYCSGLCGSSFLIGETTLAMIPGFKTQGDSPNWTLASVPFDTTNYAGKQLVFWVVVWMTDANGNLVPEMPAHGLTRNPSGDAYTQIINVPIEEYSNNVGMYGHSSRFSVVPASTPGPLGVTAQGGSDRRKASSNTSALDEVSLSFPSKTILRDQKTFVKARFSAGVNPTSGGDVAYYDGDPTKGGKLVNFQRFHPLESRASYSDLVAYKPQSCGTHTLFAVAKSDGLPNVIGTATVNVTVDPVATIQTIRKSMTQVTMSPALRSLLLVHLGQAEGFYQKGAISNAEQSIRAFTEALRGLRNGKPITSSDRLFVMANRLLSCV